MEKCEREQLENRCKRIVKQRLRLIKSGAIPVAENVPTKREKVVKNHYTTTRNRASELIGTVRCLYQLGLLDFSEYQRYKQFCNLVVEECEEIIQGGLEK